MLSAPPETAAATTGSRSKGPSAAMRAANSPARIAVAAGSVAVSIRGS